MAKRKLTPEILEQIELCASDHYTLDDIQEEANIVRSLMVDPKVIDAIQRGRVQLLIDIMVTNGDLEHFLFITGKTQAEADAMVHENKDAIEEIRSKILEEKKEIEQKKKTFSKRAMHTPGLSAMNIWCQIPENERDDTSTTVLMVELKKMVQSLKDGDNTILLELLVGNIHQLHLFNGYVTQNLMGDLGKQLPNFEKLSNMQIKVMQETRKNIMAINEITNPKRTTFIKEANQHNHLHQNSEKKDENENELQKQLEKAEQITDVELISTEDVLDEKK